jgi:hypothetical protein
MEKDTEKTIVIFRKWRKKNGGDVIALFPEIYADTTGYFCTSYEHVGQHGDADYSHVINHTTPATPAEYAELESELTSIGYNLQIQKKYFRR